jgi:hypothetical protein
MNQTTHSVFVKISLLTTNWSLRGAISLLFLCLLRRALCIAMLCVLCSVHSQIQSYVPPSGLVGCWPFNGNANDESGNGNDGVVTGVVSGATMSSLEFQQLYSDRAATAAIGSAPQTLCSLNN